MKVFLSILCVLMTLGAFAQPSEQYYSNGQLQWKGQYKSFKIKTSFGYDFARVKDGSWEYYYPDGTLAHTAHYKAKKTEAVPKNVWEYYSTDGLLLKKEHYKGGKLHQQEFYNTGLFSYTTDSFRIEERSVDTLKMIQYQQGHPYIKILVNYGNGYFEYVHMDEKDSYRLAYEIPALADDGFALKDTGKNLVGNYSFEYTKKEYVGDGNEVKGVADTFMHHWYVATGTPDFFRNISSGARTGSNFCGIRIYSRQEYLEYLENQLKDSLQKDHKYCCRVFFRLNPAAGQVTDAIGFRFDNKLLKFYYRTDQLPVPDIINKPGQLLTEKNLWMQLTGLYTAKGGERYFTIGGFRALGAQNTQVISESRKQEAYYLIDDVYIWEVERDEECPCNAYTVPDSLKPQEPVITRRTDTTTYEVGKTFIIKNIFFDIDKAELLPASFLALDSLVELLYLYPTMEIEISGHTDNTGTEERNRVLSMERAQAVVDYLVEFGIMRNRLTYAGYAADQPIDTNNTPQGRQNNRRVQFKILKM